MGTEGKLEATTARDDSLGAVEYSFWVFLAVAIGRVNQLIPGLGAIPVAKIAMIVTALALLTQRKPMPALTADGRSLVRFGCWMIAIAVVLTPFSIWRGASLAFVISDLPPLIAATVLAASMRRSWKSLRGTFLALLFCGFVLAATAALTYTRGRADDSSTMYDPNDLAYILLTVAPLGIACTVTATSMRNRISYGAVSAVMIIALLLTQSRGGLLGFLTVITLMTFIPLKPAVARGKNAVARKTIRSTLGGILVAILLGGIIYTQLPASAQQRYATLLHLSSDYNLNTEDTTGRGDIWMRGMNAFLHRPIGYGPQSYPMVDLVYGGKFKAPHNSYLQALVELGILGLFLFVRSYATTLHALQGAHRALIVNAQAGSERLEQAVFARSLQFGLVGNMVAAFFLSDAYAAALWVIFGLTIALTALVASQQHACVAAPRMTVPAAAPTPSHKSRTQVGPIRGKSQRFRGAPRKPGPTPPR